MVSSGHGRRVNVVSLTGELTNDPQPKLSYTGEPVCELRLAVGRRGRGGTREPGVVYVEVAIHGLAADDYAEALTVGRRVAVAGRLEQDEWCDETGEWRSRTWVAVDQLDLL